MWQRFTEAARRVVMLAEQEAARKNSSSVESEHLLAGLLLEPDTIITQVLEELGVKASTIQPSSLQRAVEKANAIEPSLLQRALKDASERDVLLSPPEVEELGTHYKVDPELVRQIEAYVLRKLQEQNDKPQIKLSMQGKRVLELAADEARRTYHLLKHSNAIGPEHVLLGLLRLEDSAAAVALNQAGMTLDNARESVLQQMKLRHDEAA